MMEYELDWQSYISISNKMANENKIYKIIALLRYVFVN